MITVLNTITINQLRVRLAIHQELNNSFLYPVFVACVYIWQLANKFVYRTNKMF